MAASLASFGVMVSVMNLAGYVVVVDHHHSQDSVFPIIGAHVLGMYALALVVGALIDRVGRTPALAAGLVVMGASTLGMQWFGSVPMTAVLLFGLGIGWNISFVAATAQMADRTSPAERGKLLGFNDLVAALLGATLAWWAATGWSRRAWGRSRSAPRPSSSRRWPGSCGGCPSPTRPAPEFAKRGQTLLARCSAKRVRGFLAAWRLGRVMSPPWRSCRPSASTAFGRA